MKVKFIENVLDKKNRSEFDHNPNGESTGDLFAMYAHPAYNSDDFICIVGGATVDWDYVPCVHDEVIFANCIDAPLVIGIVIAGGMLAADLIVVSTFWAMVASMVISYGMSQLMKPSIPDASSANASFDNSKTYSWDGVKNIIGEGNVVPVVYGRHKVGGVLIEAFVDGDGTTSTDGIINQDRKYLNALFAVSDGPIHGIVPGSIKINDQPLSWYTEAESWTRNGEDSQLPIMNFAKIVKHYSFSPLKQVLYGEESGIVYRMQDPCDSACLTLQAPSLYSMSDGGDILTQNVDFAIYISRDQESPTWIKVKECTLSGKTKSSIEGDVYIYPPDAYKSENWLIRIVRKTDNYALDPKVSCTTYLKSVQERLGGSLSYPGTALFGVRIKATDRLSGSMPTFTADVIGRKLADVRDGSITEASACNTANVVYDLLTNVNYGLGRYMGASNIDIESLRDFADWCDELVQYKRWNDTLGAFVTTSEKRYEINLVVDTKFRAVDLIEKILGACRAIPFWEGDRFKVVVERPSTEYAQMFSMGNIKKDSFSSTYSSIENVANQVEIQFLDEEDDYKQKTVLAADKTRVFDYPEISQANIYGITKQSTAKREAVFQMKRARAITRQITFSASVDAIVCQVGDLVLFQHDVPQWGFGGRVVGTSTSRVVIDRDVPIIVGRQYSLKIRTKDGQFRTATFTATATATTSEMPVSPHESISEGDVWMFGEVGREGKPFRVMSIERKDIREFTLTCQEYNEDVFIEDENVAVRDLKYSYLGLTERFDLDGNVANPTPSNGTYVEPTVNSKTEVPPLVENVTVGEQLAIVGNVYRSDIVVTFSAARMPDNSLSRIVKYKVIYSTDEGKTWRTDGETGENGYYRMLGVHAGSTYYIHVKPYTSNETTNYPEIGANALLNQVIVRGKVSPPLAPSNLTITGEVFQLNLKWSNPGEPLDYVEVWCATENTRASAIKDTSVKGDRFNHSGLAHGVTYYYWLRAFDTAGNSSAWYPASDTGGVSGSPAATPDTIMSILGGSIDESLLATELLEKINSGGEIGSAVSLLKNQWTVKIQENDYVAGMGLALYEDWKTDKAYVVGEYVWGPDSQVYKCKLANAGHQPPSATYWDLIEYGAKSEFIVLSDKFAIVQPDGQGGLKAPFVVGSVNGVSTVGIDGTLVVDGTLTANKIQAGSLTLGVFNPTVQAAIQSSVSVANWQSPNDPNEIDMAAIDGRTVLNVVEGGAVQVGNGNIILDSSDNGITQGRIIVAPNGGTTGHDYVQIDNGEVSQKIYDPVTNSHYQYKSLNRIEFGQVLANGSNIVPIPGFWKAKPVVMVSPAIVGIYDTSSRNQDQELQLTPGNVIRQPGQLRKYQFTPTVALKYSSGSLSRTLTNTATFNWSATVNPNPTYVWIGNRKYCFDWYIGQSQTVIGSEIYPDATTNLRQIIVSVGCPFIGSYNYANNWMYGTANPTLQIWTPGIGWTNEVSGGAEMSQLGNPNLNATWTLSTGVKDFDISKWRVSWAVYGEAQHGKFTWNYSSETDIYLSGTISSEGIVNWIAMGE